MFDLMTNVSLPDGNKNIVAKFLNTDALKKSVNLLWLSKCKVDSERNNTNVLSTGDVFSIIGYNYEEISNKLGFVINNNLQGLTVKTDSGMCLQGKVHVRGETFADFRENFRNPNEMKQFCEFIDDLHFLKRSAGEQVKSKFNKNGNIKFYISSRSQITRENMLDHFGRVLKERHSKLCDLRRGNCKLQKSISQIETEITSKQLINEMNHAKIEEFTFSKNNFISALKYYYLKKENSIYNRLTSKFIKDSEIRSQEIFNDSLGSSSSSSSNDDLQNNNLTLRLSKNKETLKDNIEELTKMVSFEQESKRKLLKKHNTLKKVYKKVEENEETIKYVLQKINQHSNSVWEIIKYRKQVIKDLKIYGFKVAAA